MNEFNGLILGRTSRGLKASRAVAVFLSATIACLVAMPSVSDAQRVPAFTEKGEGSCQSAVGKGGTKLVSSTFKLWSKCYSAELKGGAPCTAVDTASLETKFTDGYDKKCGPLGDATVQTSIGLGGVTFSAPNIAASAVADVGSLVGTALTDISAGLTDSDVAKCLNGIAKAIGKAGSAQLKTDGKCMDGNDKQQIKDPNAPAKCDETKRLASRDKSRQKGIDSVEKNCSDMDVSTASGGAYANATELIDAVIEGTRTHEIGRAHV